MPKIYTYTGDVNHGQDFYDIFLQSDGAGTFFSNVIISNVEIGLEEGWYLLYSDVERNVTKSFEINFGVQRNFIQPIIVPFIGENFYHFVESVTLYRNGALRIILPKLTFRVRFIL